MFLTAEPTEMTTGWFYFFLLFKRTCSFSNHKIITFIFFERQTGNLTNWVVVGGGALPQNHNWGGNPSSFSGCRDKFIIKTPLVLLFMRYAAALAASQWFIPSACESHLHVSSASVCVCAHMYACVWLHSMDTQLPHSWTAIWLLFIYIEREIFRSVRQNLPPYCSFSFDQSLTKTHLLLLLQVS